MPGLNREFGLAVVGCGAIGRIRAELARDYPGVGWLGLCDIDAEVGHKLQQDTGADFFTTDFAELIARPEVDATIIATTENDHTRSILAAVEQGQALFIEKPLATNARESEQVPRGPWGRRQRAVTFAIGCIEVGDPFEKRPIGRPKAVDSCALDLCDETLDLGPVHLMELVEVPGSKGRPRSQGPASRAHRADKATPGR